MQVAVIAIEFVVAARYKKTGNSKGDRIILEFSVFSID